MKLFKHLATLCLVVCVMFNATTAFAAESVVEQNADATVVAEDADSSNASSTYSTNGFVWQQSMGNSKQSLYLSKTITKMTYNCVYNGGYGAVIVKLHNLNTGEYFTLTLLGGGQYTENTARSYPSGSYEYWVVSEHGSGTLVQITMNFS